jgi:hypothetical protein
MRKVSVVAILALTALIGLGPILSGSALADVTSNKIDKNEKIQVAIQEVSLRIPGIECGESDNWAVDGNLDDAVDFLKTELETRGWDIVDHGALEHSYAVVLDPDPSDDRAVAIAGLIEETETVSFVFLERCTLPEQSQ